MNRYKIEMLKSIGLENNADFSKNYNHFQRLAKKCNCMCAGCAITSNSKFDVDYVGTKENLLKLLEKHYGGIESNPGLEFKRLKKANYAYFFENGEYPVDL